MLSQINKVKRKWNLKVFLQMRYFVFLFVFFVFMGMPLFYGIHGKYISNLGDAQQLIWQSHNLIEVIKTHSTILTTSFFGVETPYAYTPIAVVQSLVYLGIYLITSNITISYNLSIGIFLFLNFVSMYYVLRSWGRSQVTSLIFSFIFSFASSTLLHTGHISLFIVFTIPLFIYLLFSFKENPTLKQSLLLALTYSATFYIHEYYGFLLTLIGIIFLLVFYKSLITGKLIKQLAICGFSILFLMLPFIKISYDRSSFDTTNNISSKRSSEEAFYYSANPFSYLSPPNDSLLYYPLDTYRYKNVVAIEQTNYLGLINIFLLVLGGVLIWTGKMRADTRSVTFFLFVALTGLILSFGPYMIINGSKVRLPVMLGFKLRIPPFEMIRAYARFGIIVFTVACIGSSFVYEKIIVYKKIFGKEILILPIIIFSALDLYPFRIIPTSSIKIPEKISILKEDTDNEAFVANIPFQTDGSSFNSTSMLFQTIHDKRIVNGYSSFENPLWKEKINKTSIKCFAFSSYKEQSCNAIASKSLIDEKVKYLIYEKKTIEPLPGLLAAVPELEARKSILERFYQVIKEKISEDDNYIIGKVY